MDDRNRTYLLHIPSGFDSAKQYSLVLGFHGGGGTGEKFAGQTGFREKADEEGFIAVFPDGTEHNWNDGRDTTDAFKQGVDDVKFVRALVSNLNEKLPIDSNKIYATGVSNGGIFSHRLGCEMADVFAAVGPVIGSLASNLAPKCNPAAPVSVVVIQGTVDPFIPIEGGDTHHKTFPRLGDGGLVESAENAMRLWTSKNGCSDKSTVTKLPPASPKLPIVLAAMVPKFATILSKAWVIIGLLKKDKRQESLAPPQRILMLPRSCGISSRIIRDSK